MGYFMLLLCIIMWSFVGVLVKLASQWVDSSIITFCRFFFGVLFLGIIILVKDKKLSIKWSSKWIWIGALGKSINYIFENLGVSMGYAYSQILVYPANFIFLAFVTCFYFKEKITPRTWFAIGLCLVGMLFVSWNGKPVSLIVKTSGVISLIFIISAIGYGIHNISQKVLIQDMESGQMNLSVFLIATVITAIPLPFTGKFYGSFSISALASLIVLGAITGITFYIFSNSLKTVPFLTAIILSNSVVLFSLVWAILIFKEPITYVAVIGTIIFFIGIIILNLPSGLTIKRILTLKNGR